METLSDILETTAFEKVAGGFVFTEGPVWHPDGFFYFVDVRDSKLFSITLGQPHKLVRQTTGGQIRFLVFTAPAGGDLDKAGLPVAVAPAELGFKGAVRVRDLWTHTDLAEQRGTFAPVIPWHGAGLYRFSPVAEAQIK